MTQDDRFRRIKLLFGTLDDLNQQRRKIYTDWGTGKVPPDEFGERIAANLRTTRDTATELLELVQPGG